MALLDEKDCIILNLLQKDCRISLTNIAKKVNLSVDSVTKRIKKLQDNNIFWPKIQLRPRNFGFKNIVDVKIKLLYKSEKRISEFTSYLVRNPYVSEIFSISGEYDFSLVIIAKDAIHLGNITSDIRYKFGDIITSWSETLTTNSHKFENYDMCALMGHPEDKINFFS